MGDLVADLACVLAHAKVSKAVCVGYVLKISTLKAIFRFLYVHSDMIGELRSATKLLACAQIFLMALLAPPFP
jgi:hypothetical protein